MNNSSCSFNCCHTCMCACECSFWIVKHDKYRISTAWSGTGGSAEGTNSDRPMRVIRSRYVNSNSYHLIHTSDSLDGIWFALRAEAKIKWNLNEWKAPLRAPPCKHRLTGGFKGLTHKHRPPSPCGSEREQISAAGLTSGVQTETSEAVAAAQ